MALALGFPRSRWLLIDSSARRAAFLREAVGGLDLQDRVEVREERAEATGRSTEWRGSRDLVVARSFGPPAVVAECGAPLLQAGGRLVVSEPPPSARDRPRWPERELGLLGLSPRAVVTAQGARFQVLYLDGPCPDRYPRRTGVPAKRPLF